MSAKETKPDFDGEFLQTLNEWREKNKIRDDDAVYLLVELFRIHQKHWDALRQLCKTLKNAPDVGQILFDFRCQHGNQTPKSRPAFCVMITQSAP